MRNRLIVAGLIVLASAAPEARAQDGGATFGGGAIRYHMQGAEGTTWALAARFELPIKLYAILEPSFTFFRWQPVVGAKVSYIIPEASLQVQGYVGRARPYIGGGIGYATPTRGIP